MFGMQHTLRQVSSGIAIAASLAVIAAPSSSASTSSRSFITDTLGGNGSAKALPDVVDRFIARHGADSVAYVNGGMSPAVAQSNQVRVNQDSSYVAGAYVNGGASPAVATAIRDLAKGITPTPASRGDQGGTAVSWGDAGIGAGLAAGLLLLVLGGTRHRTHKRPVVTA